MKDMIEYLYYFILRRDLKMIDTAHLSMPASMAPFTFSSATLARLVASCSYQPLGDKILFGIRAGRLLDAQYGHWYSEVTIVENTLDGENLHCLIGIWDLTTQQIALFPASTIAHIYWQTQQVASPERYIANCLGSGMYHYRVGAHEPEGRPFEEGAFRLSRLQPVFAWRFYQNEHRYSLSQGIPTLSVVNDHIHSAQTKNQPTSISYSSAGCQVIEGDHTPPAMPTGWYQAFRILSGQSAMPSPIEVGNEYRYILTHVRHLEAIATGENAEMFLQGSVGMTVRLLQEALISRGYLDENDIDKGYFNGYTAKALYDFQKSQYSIANGIATKRDLKKLGVSIVY